MVAVGESAAHADRTIENTLSGPGREVAAHGQQLPASATMAKTYKEAMTTPEKGLKVIVAEGECQLERQRRLKPQVAKKLAEGKRTVRVKYGVDEDTCTGDHSCIRLSGCPTLTVKDNPDPLRRDPVATVIDGCVGCGLCGENAHAAVLCPSFYRAEVIQNPSAWDKLIARRNPMNLPERPITILIAALGGEGGGVMADWLMEAATASGYPAQATSIPGRGAAHRRHHLLPGDLSCERAELDGQRAGALAHAQPRQRRRDGGLRADRGRPRHAQRLRQPGAHHAHRLHAPHLRHGGEDADGRRPLRERARARGRASSSRSARCCSTCASSRRRAAR